MQDQGKKIKNMGKIGTMWLNSIGIYSMEDLVKIGSVEAYKRIKELHHDANILVLYALEAGLWDLHWNELSPELKDMLHQQVGYQPKMKRRKKKKWGELPY